MLLEKYAADHGYLNAQFIYDDGFTGTNFDRPGWKKVEALIKNGQVKTLIVKDMSRLGREYLQVGQYTEIMFPSYGVHFIAVNDGVDSDDESTVDFSPFRNLLNEMYAKDCSKKGRCAAKQKAESGARVASRPPYGYQKDPADPKRHIIPDEEAAEVVRHIFRLCAAGSGPTQIAKRLQQEQIPSPGYHYYQKNGKILTNVDLDKPYSWSQKTVAKILEDESYLGHTINLKTTTRSFKDKHVIQRPESEQVRIENTHEPLIDRETWDIVQDIRKHKRRRTNMDEQNIFSGLVYCMDCGSTMVLHRAHTMANEKNCFMCGTYKKQGKEVCTAHYIREQELAAILLDDIRRVTCLAREHEEQFARCIQKKHQKSQQQEMNELQKQIAAMEKRQRELTILFKKLYEDRVLERIVEEQFQFLAQEYTAEQKKLQVDLPEAENRLQALKDSTANAERFLENAKKYTEIPALTAELLHTFIERVEVGERSAKYSRSATQEIRIYYRGVGLLDILPENLQKTPDHDAA